MLQKYIRQMSLPEMGLEAQKRLIGSSVMVVGAGGLGCACLPYLAASGISRIGILDFDRVELSNLARQTLYSTSDVGQFKVEVAKKRLQLMYPEVNFEIKKERLTTHNAQKILSKYNLIIDGTDNLEARLAINDNRKPWVYGSIYQWQAQVSLFLPQNPDYRTLFPDGPPSSTPLNCTTGGVLGPFVGLIGTIQALTAIKWLAGIEENLANHLLLVDGKKWTFKLMQLSPTPNYEISHSLFQEWMSQGDIQLIDVREAHEKENGDLGGELLTRATLKEDTKIVLYCQSGRRSLTWANRLRAQGFEAYSLEGGVNSVP